MKDKITRKSIGLYDSMWKEVFTFRFKKRIGTESEAVRQLIQKGLEANGKRT